MLCRAVLAAATVSCTFSLALAITQGTELVQLKDLVCVLWLSGLQKEDLDVNLLRKLERHNVNMDDIMNNETMRRECTPNKPEPTSTTVTKTKKPVLKMKITATLSTTLDPAKSANVTKEKYFDTIVKLISNAHPSNSNIVEKKTEKPKMFTNIKNIIKTTMMSPKFSKTNTPFVTNSKEEADFIKFLKTITPIETEYKEEADFDKFTNTKTPYATESKGESDFVPKEPNFKMQNILNFWQTMSNTKTPKTIDEELSSLRVISSKNLFKQKMLQKRVPKLITPRPYFTTSAPPRHMERFIADFVSNNMDQEVSTTADTNQGSPNDLGELYFLQLYRDLIKSYNVRQNLENDVNNQVQTNMVNKMKQQDYINYSKMTTDEPEIEKVMPDVFREVDDVFKAKEKFDNPLKVNKDQRPSITRKTLKEIADSVKDMVLKDIGQLIKPATPTNTRLELTALPTFPKIRSSTSSHDPGTHVSTPPPLSNKTDANNVMDKILDIYQRIKSISDKTDASLDAKYKQLSLNQDVNCLTPSIASQTIANINFAHRTNQNNNQNMPSQMITHTNVVHRTKNIHNILMNPTSYRDLTQQELQKMPSIIQTNSGEVAPLVLPYANPMKIINQILVVTTENTVKKSDTNSNDKVRSRFESFMEDLKKHRIHSIGQKKIEQRYSIPTHERYSHFGYSDINHSHKDHIDTPRKHEQGDGDGYDQSHKYRTVHRGGANVKLRNFKDIDNGEHINYSDVVLGNSGADKIPMHHHREKFHEQLEKGRWSDSKQDFTARERDSEYNRHVAPRHQQPLNVRNYPYDDTHFRNFLKTQQKVNDMLEKILGTKAKIEGYSVETA